MPCTLQRSVRKVQDCPVLKAIPQSDKSKRANAGENCVLSVQENQAVLLSSKGCFKVN